MKNDSNLGSYNGDALDTKTIILRCIDNTPGIRFRELLRLSGLTHGSLEYNLRILERTNKVNVERHDGMRSGFYIIGTPTHDSPVLGHIRRTPQRQIVIFILENEVCSFGEILVHINKVPSTLSWHLKKLSDAGIISVIHRQKCHLYRIVNSKLVSYVLSKYGQSLGQNC
jgi:predicted transcriptional regulator